MKKEIQREEKNGDIERTGVKFKFRKTIKESNPYYC